MTKQGRRGQQPPRVITKRQRARWEREQTLNRRILFGVGGAIALALLLALGGVIYDRLYLPSRTVARVGDERFSYRQYRTFREISLVQQISQSQSQISSLQQFLSQFQGEQAEAFAQQFQQQRQQAELQLESAVAELNALDSAPLSYQALDQLIEQALVLQGAEREGLTVSDEQLSSKLAEQFTPPPTPEPTPITATNALSPTDSISSTGAISPTATPTLTPDEAATTIGEGIQSYHDSVVQMLEQYNYKPEFSEQDLRAFVERQQRVDMLREQIEARLVPEAPKALQVNARHILLEVSVPTTATEELREQTFASVKQEADRLYSELQQGADFAQLASEHSADPGSKDKGGELGWASPENYVPEFKEAVLNQPIGEIGQPVRTEYGWHIIEVLGREERPDESKLETERSTKFQEWLEQQRAALTVERYPEPTPVPTVEPVPTSEVLPTTPLTETQTLSPTLPITR